MTQAKEGNTVKVHFTGKTEDGQVFASSRGQDPLEFKLGEGKMLSGIEKAISGMEEGQSKTVTVEAEEGYGLHDEKFIFELPRNEFPPDIELKKGMHLQFQQTDGSEVIFTVLEHSEEKVRLDANHPLAGATLTFELQLVQVA